MASLVKLGRSSSSKHNISWRSLVTSEGCSAAPARSWTGLDGTVYRRRPSIQETERHRTGT